MGLAKKVMATKSATETVAADKSVVESGTEAALERLKVAPKSETVKTIEKAQYKPRDFDKEARGKTRCVQFEAALMSPAIAGMQFNTMEEYLKLVRQAADAGVAYSFEE